MDQEIRFCSSADGVQLAYSTAGSGPPLVRVAHWLTHLELDWKGPIWSHWFEELSRSHTLVRYDLRGTGLSDRDVEDLSLDALVCDLQAVVDDVGFDRFSLMGLCQGGPIAVAYAARHPDRVRQLTVYGGYSRGAFTEGTDPAKQQRAEALREMIEVGWGKKNAAFRNVFVDLLMPDGPDEQQRWLAELERKSTSPELATRLWRAFHLFDVHELAPQVRAPTLFFHVENDGMVPFEEGRRLAGLIPDTRFVPLESNNHLLQPDEPAWDRFVSEFRRFVPTENKRSVRENGFGELTPRESEVVDLVAQGLSNRQIADRLCISPKTVRNHITRIFSKLDVSRRAEAIVQARDAGFGQNGSG